MKTLSIKITAYEDYIFHDDEEYEKVMKEIDSGEIRSPSEIWNDHDPETEVDYETIELAVNSNGNYDALDKDGRNPFNKVPSPCIGQKDGVGLPKLQDENLILITS